MEWIGACHLRTEFREHLLASREFSESSSSPAILSKRLGVRLSQSRFLNRSTTPLVTSSGDASH